MKKIRIALIVLMVFAHVFISLNTPATGASAPKYGGTLKILSMQKPSGPVGVPWLNGPGCELIITPTLENFFDIDNDLNITPRLATSWELAPDKLSITIKLREGVKFHDGTEFNAEAVKWNIDTGLANRWRGLDNWKSVDVIDTYTVRINFKYFANSFWINFSEGGNNRGFISPTAFEKNGEEWAKLNPVGTGPFKIDSFNRDTGGRLVRNDEYWQKGKPYLDAIEVNYVLEALPLTMSFRNGEAQAIYIPRGYAVKTKSELVAEGYKLAPLITGAGVFQFMPDSANADSPLTDKTVREAIEYAINRPDLAKAMGEGLTPASYQLAANGCVGYNADLEGYRSYNPEKARQLLSEAGYNNNLNITIYNDSGMGTDLAVAIQAMLAKVGVTCEIINADHAMVMEYMMKGWHNGYFVSAIPSSINYASVLERMFAGDQAYGCVKKPDGLQDIIKQAVSTPDHETEIKLTKQAVRMIVEDAMVVPLYEHEGLFIYDGKIVNDADFSQVTHVFFRPDNVWLTK